MQVLVQLLKIISVLAGAVILGNWFMAELRRARSKKLPWYAPYLSPPGLIILTACILPIVYWLATR
jgi:hypothetical protein